MEQKQCNKCGELKVLDEFRKGHKQCKGCEQEYKREYYQKNIERLRESSRKRMHEYREYRECPVSKKRRQTNMREYQQLSKVKERRDKYIHKHMREYRQRPEVKERFRKYMCIYVRNREAKKHLLPNTLTQEQWQQSLNYWSGCCAVCGRQMNDMFREFRAAMDHWIPINYKGDDNPGTVATNIVPLCHGTGGCNNHKSNIMPDIWLERKFGKRKAKKIMAKIQAYFESIRQ